MKIKTSESRSFLAPGLLTVLAAVIVWASCFFSSTPLAGNTPPAIDMETPSETQQAAEYKIKAAYLYNFLLFTQWPDPNEKKSDKKNLSAADEKEEVMTIGIIGDDPFGEHFDDVEGQIIKSKDKKLVIKRFGPYRKNLELGKCQLLFICSPQKRKLDDILYQIRYDPILTVGESRGFLEEGGMINLVKVKNKIRWEINLAAAKDCNIQLSAQLLRNAVRVLEIPKPKK